VYEVNEVLDCCAELPERLRRLRMALATWDNDVTDCHESTFGVTGEIEHLRRHMTRVMRVLRRIQDETRNMPPLSELSDDEYGVSAARKAIEGLRKVIEAGRAERAARTRPPAVAEDAPVGVRKRGRARRRSG
jgi:hypothetical protein